MNIMSTKQAIAFPEGCAIPIKGAVWSRTGRDSLFVAILRRIRGEGRNCHPFKLSRLA